MYCDKNNLLHPRACNSIFTAEEIHKNASLIEWAKSMKDKKVNGFTNHFWNGVTTLQWSSNYYNLLINKNLKNKIYNHI